MQTREFSGAPTGQSDLGHRDPGLLYRLAERLISRYPGLAAYVVRRHPRVAEMYRQMRDRGIMGHLRAHYPTLMHVARFAGWSLAVLKRTFFGIGGAALLVVAGLFVAGALIESLRWYLAAAATLLLLLGAGLLGLSYVQSWLNRFVRSQRQSVKAVTDSSSRDNKASIARVEATLDELKKSLSASEAALAELKEEVSNIQATSGGPKKTASESERKVAQLKKDSSENH